MNDQPVYLRILTENELPILERNRCAEVVIQALIKAQQAGYHAAAWLRRAAGNAGAGRHAA